MYTRTYRISIPYASSIERVRAQKFFSKENRSNFYIALLLVSGGVMSTGLVHLLNTHADVFGSNGAHDSSNSAEEVVGGVRVRRTLGIPYAVPLRSRDRFAAPRLLDYRLYLRELGTKWHGGFIRLGCPQLNWTPFPRRPITQTNSEDDCLYLNVWQPLDGGEDSSCDACGQPLLPAVVVLHGGRFQHGGGGGPYAFYDGKYLAAAWNAVVVVPAYRVGVFGFLNAALPEAPGNVGIRDQIVALRWVRDNVHLFGASPSQVTLLGHEAGAASVGYHLLSNRSAAFFQRAVLMAGSPYTPYPSNSGTAAADNVRALADTMQCPGTSAGRAAVACLRARSIKATLAAIEGSSLEFGPSFLSPAATHQEQETAVVYQNPPDMNAHFRPLDLVAGYTRNEGAPYVLEMFRLPRLHFNDETRGGEVLSSLVVWLHRHGVREPSEVLDFYGLRAPEFTEKRGTDVLVTLEELLGDMHVYCPVNYLVEEATALGSRVFAYEFAQIPYYRWWVRWKGVPQMLDLMYASGLMHAIQHEFGLEHKELVFAQDMATAFAAFVWNGEPPPESNWTHWETFRRGPLVFVGSESGTYARAASMPHERNCAFWRRFLHPLSAAATPTSAAMTP